MAQSSVRVKYSNSGTRVCTVEPECVQWNQSVYSGTRVCTVEPECVQCPKHTPL